MRAERKGRVLRLKKPPKQPSIKTLERSYYSDMLKMLDRMKFLVDQRLVPMLPSIVRHAQSVRPKTDGTRADDYTDDVEGIMDGIRDDFFQEYDENQIKFFAQKAAKRGEEFNQKSFQRQFKAVFGIQMPLVEPYLEATVNGFVKQNVSLITSIPETYFDRVENTVLQGAISGDLQDEIASEISDIYDVSDSRAAFIARDQVAKLNGNLTEMRQTEVGVTSYIWSTSLDERVRDSHAAKEGETFQWDDPPADTGHPGEDYQCRCTAIPVFEEADTGIDEQAA